MPALPFDFMRILCALAALPYKVRRRLRDRPFSPILRWAPTLHRDRRYPLFFVRKEKLRKEKGGGKVVTVVLLSQLMKKEKAATAMLSLSLTKLGKSCCSGREKNSFPHFPKVLGGAVTLFQKGPARNPRDDALPAFSLAEKGAKKKLSKRNADRGAFRAVRRASQGAALTICALLKKRGQNF
jgi:hypothetical protein